MDPTERMIVKRKLRHNVTFPLFEWKTYRLANETAHTEDQANLEEKSELHATTSPDSIQRASEQTLSPKTVKIRVLT